MRPGRRAQPPRSRPTSSPDPPVAEVLTAAQARRISVTAQGLGRAHPRGAVRRDHLERVLDTMAVLQVDSVNVLVRSHYLPVFSRLGPYPRTALDRLCHTAPRRLVEYWAHQASYAVPAVHRLLHFRMAAANDETWQGLRRLARDQPHLLDAVREVVTRSGPLTSARIEAELAGPDGIVRAGSREHWGWNWSGTKQAVEYLFRTGDLASAGRTGAFERRYDLPDRVLPAQALPAPLPEPQACQELMAIAGAALGVGTEACLRDYFRLTARQSRPAVAALVEAGRLLPVRVQGWRAGAYLDPRARRPARVGGSALLSPFDPLVWFRPRTEALFGVRYRIGIYTPAAQRTHGYYVLPYLIGDRLAALVDLKADRAAGALRVQAAWLTAPTARGRLDGPTVARSLAQDLRRTADWLDLETVAPHGRGDLVPDLVTALGRGPGPLR